jgi:hypothetical protein
MNEDKNILEEILPCPLCGEIPKINEDVLPLLDRICTIQCKTKNCNFNNVIFQLGIMFFNGLKIDHELVESIKSFLIRKWNEKISSIKGSKS